MPLFLPVLRFFYSFYHILGLIPFVPHKKAYCIILQ